MFIKQIQKDLLINTFIALLLGIMIGIAGHLHAHFTGELLAKYHFAVQYVPFGALVGLMMRSAVIGLQKSISYKRNSSEVGNV